MVTNIILIVTILGIFLGITNTSLIFGEVQQDTQISQQNDLAFMTSNLQESSFDLLNNSNNEELTTQSHGLIKNKDIGVLVYTHGNPMEPHNEDMMKTELIEKNLEKSGHPAEVVTHMPYNWDLGLMNLDNENVKYAIFLYTDLFGPQSTVIHNVTRGIFGGIEAYKFCTGVPLPNGVCMYMGETTEPASDVSDTVLVFAEPARPDHHLLQNIFLEQAQQVSENPKKEILVLVGHGARSDTNDMAQVLELGNVADYVKKKLKFQAAVGVTAREDWPELQEERIMDIVNLIKNLLKKTHAQKVILAPATGAGTGFEMVKMAVEAEGIEVEVAPEPFCFAQKEFKQWSSQVLKETVDFIKKKAPEENTITPYWNRNY